MKVNRYIETKIPMLAQKLTVDGKKESINSANHVPWLE